MKKYYLTVYYPVSGEPKNKLSLEIKSLIQKTLLKKGIGENSTINTRVAKFVQGNIENMSSFGSGLAIFVRFDERDIDEDTLKIIALSAKPQKNVIIGNSFDVNQLANLENSNGDSLVLKIDRFECDIYKLHGDNLQKIDNLNNEKLYDYDKEYLEQYSHNAANKTFTGSGTNTHERKEETEHKRFINQIKKYLDNKKLDNKQKIIFYSNNFSDFIKDEFEDAKLIAKNIQDENRLAREAIKAAESARG